MTSVDTVRTPSTTFGAGVRAGPSGLVLDDALDLDGWEKVGQQIFRVGNAGQWWLGDWCSFGYWTYGDASYREVIDRTGLAYQTVANYRSVCEEISLSRRREGLSFGHHEAVCVLEPIDQELALDRAEREGLSVMALRNVVRGMRQLSPAPTIQVPEADALRSLASVLIQPEWAPRRRHWAAAADAAGVGFVDWAADALDKAAA